MNGSSLGAVIRPYEIEAWAEKRWPSRVGRNERRRATSRRAFSMYEPDGNGELEVLAHCERHVVRQPKHDVVAGVVAVCPDCEVPR